MLTIRQIHNKPQRVKGVGLEVEVEFTGTPPLDIGGVWLVKQEGSLRNGMEYYTRQPIPISGLREHCKRLQSKLTAHGVVEGSPRTSVHVHVNVQDFTPLQVWTASLAYWILENPLMHFCGTKYRVGNLFCLRATDAQGLMDLCYEDLNGTMPFSRLPNDTVKYSGQNLAAVQRFGSLEYRGMRGTIDPDLIELWSRTVYNMVDRATTFESPAALMNYYIKSSKDEFLNYLLDADFIEHVKAIPNYVGIIEDNVMMLSELAYYHDDWKAWQEKINDGLIKRGFQDRPTPVEPAEVPPVRDPLVGASAMMQAQAIIDNMRAAQAGGADGGAGQFIGLAQVRTARETLAANMTATEVQRRWFVNGNTGE